MLEVFGIAFGLIIASKLMGLHTYCERCRISVKDELKIVK